MKLRAENLVKKYKQRTVVNHVSVEVSQGEIVGLLGPNGAGKTTSFYMIVGLIKPNEGEIFLDSENITPLPMYKRARMGTQSRIAAQNWHVSRFPDLLRRASAPSAAKAPKIAVSANSSCLPGRRNGQSAVGQVPEETDKRVIDPLFATL